MEQSYYRVHFVSEIDKSENIWRKYIYIFFYLIKKYVHAMSIMHSNKLNNYTSSLSYQFSTQAYSRSNDTLFRV